jgi:hypothetical protein
LYNTVPFQVLSINESNCNTIVNILLNLEFYSNFQKIVELNSKKSLDWEVEEINRCIAELLGRNFAQIKPVDIQRHRNPVQRENLCKYFLDFNKNIISNVESQQAYDRVESFIGATRYDEGSCFFKLVKSIVTDGDKKQFKNEFGEFLTINRKYLNGKLNFVVEAEVRILLEIALHCSYSTAFSEITKYYNRIDINAIRIRSEKNKFLYAVLAYKGYYVLIRNFNLDDTVILREIYHECLKGSASESNQEEKRKPIADSNYDKVIDAVIGNENFDTSQAEFNPMRDAVECNNKYAV